jgi:hypothetical protein
MHHRSATDSLSAQGLSCLKRQKLQIKRRSLLSASLPHGALGVEVALGRVDGLLVASPHQEEGFKEDLSLDALLKMQ